MRTDTTAVSAWKLPSCLLHRQAITIPRQIWLDLLMLFRFDKCSGLALVMAAFVLLAGGCSWFSRPFEEKPAEQLIKEGLEAFDDGQYKTAIKHLEQLKDWYPFSKYAILAQLKIADAYYRLEQYPDAIYAYQEFEQLHPRNEAVPYVIYQIGRCYFDQIGTVDRDQRSARQALDVFQRLIRQHPESSYARRAGLHVTACQRSLAGHDLYVALFYYKSKHYKAALERLKKVVTRYPDTGVHFRALRYWAKYAAMVKRDSMPVSDKNRARDSKKPLQSQ